MVGCCKDYLVFGINLSHEAQCRLDKDQKLKINGRVLYAYNDFGCYRVRKPPGARSPEFDLAIKICGSESEPVYVLVCHEDSYKGHLLGGGQSNPGYLGEPMGLAKPMDSKDFLFWTRECLIQWEENRKGIKDRVRAFLAHFGISGSPEPLFGTYVKDPKEY